MKAIQLVGERVGTVVRQSSFIETEPWGFESANRFVNAVILCETTKTPREVLRLTQQIERVMGRKSKSGARDSDAFHFARIHPQNQYLIRQFLPFAKRT